MITDADFIHFGVALITVHRDDGAHRSHVIAPVTERVLVADLFRLVSNATSNRRRREGSLHGVRGIDATRHFPIDEPIFDVLVAVPNNVERANKTPESL